MDYYQNTYGIKIKDVQQPLLCHKVKKKELKDQVRSMFFEGIKYALCNNIKEPIQPMTLRMQRLKNFL